MQMYMDVTVWTFFNVAFFGIPEFFSGRGGWWDPMITWNWSWKFEQWLRKNPNGYAGVFSWLTEPTSWICEQWLLNPYWLIIIGDSTALYIGDYSTPIEESLFTNQYSGMRDGYWTLLFFWKGDLQFSPSTPLKASCGFQDFLVFRPRFYHLSTPAQTFTLFRCWISPVL